MMTFDIIHPNSGSKTRSFTRTRAEQEKAAGYRETKEHLMLFVCDLVRRKRATVWQNAEMPAVGKKETQQLGARREMIP